jgi:hypothetical protein
MSLEPHEPRNALIFSFTMVSLDERSIFSSLQAFAAFSSGCTQK